MAPTFMSRGLSPTKSLYVVILVLVVIAAVCTIILIVILASNRRFARRTTGSTKPGRPVSQLSEKSFSSPDAKMMTIFSAPIHRRKSSLFWNYNKGQPSRPERPAQPWGEATSSSERVSSTRARLSMNLVKAFSMRRSRSNVHSQPTPVTEQPITLPTVRTVAAPKKALPRDRAWGASPAGVGTGQSPCRDRVDYRPPSSRPPFRKPYPSPLSFRKRPDGDVAPDESILPL